ncbi:hypothetical protein PYW08_006066 [Mythimna loreyi]|uniref:Uncharacterized protein n=1 Tax=Mythimna loreyi TaxID=667449 RepID=A0ACC2QNP5_9NEOP|nr:hypothetical protein PYW08_006066 [Mythimna loreyi]
MASKSRSLIEDVNTNTEECFNSIIAELTGGKRINFALRVVTKEDMRQRLFRLTRKLQFQPSKNLFQITIPVVMQDIEKRRAKKRKLNMKNPVRKRRVLKDTS